MSGDENLVGGVQKKLAETPPKPRGLSAKFQKVLDRQTCLYRYFDADGVLLYVGISVSALVRLRRHKREAAWFDKAATIKIERFRNRWNAAVAEYLAIKNEKPLHNSPRWRFYISNQAIDKFLEMQKRGEA